MTSALAGKIFAREKWSMQNQHTHIHTPTHKEFYVDYLDFCEIFSAFAYLNQRRLVNNKWKSHFDKEHWLK